MIPKIFRKTLPGAEGKTLKKLEKKIGYVFSNQLLLKRALSHKSFINEKRLSSLEQNERFEYLGDAVLELVISHLLMEHFPDAPEGELSKLRAAVVNETSLAELAREINLGDFLYLGKGEDQCGGRDKDSLLSDAFEAVLGAVYLDSGFKKSFQVIYRLLKNLLERAVNEDIIQDFKTKLQEESQIRFRSIPQYRLVSEKGPDHNKTFEIHLHINDQHLGTGIGKSKKQAEQKAAKETLDKLENVS